MLGDYEPPGRTRHTDFAGKFNKFVFKTDTCWLWIGAMYPAGYGVVKNAGKNEAAHRWVYEHEVGPIPEGMELDHLCRVRRCVNPQHLEPVTKQENFRRGLKPYTIRTLCRNGLHDITRPEAWYVKSDGKRTCRECRVASERRRYE